MSESQMSDKQFTRLFYSTIVLLVVLTLILIFIASINSSEVTARLEAQRQESINTVVAERVQPVGVLNIGEPQEISAADAGGEPLSGDKVYQQACLACHESGVAGAPAFGDEAAWKDRIAKGEDTLYDHAINGFQGEAGVMPAKGGNTSLSDDEVRAAVDYMLGAAGHTTAAAAESASGESASGESASGESASGESASGESASGESASGESASGESASGESASGESASGESASGESASGGKSAESSGAGEAIYQQACVACHSTGVAGSPKLGDKDAWSERIAKGKDTLYDHAINGFQGETGVMPAKGGQTQLSDEDVRAAVDYMVNETQ